MDKIKKLLPDRNILYYMSYVIWFSGSLLFGRSTLDTFLGISAGFWLKKICYPACAVFILTVLFFSEFHLKPDKKEFRQYVFIGILVALFGWSWMLSGWGTYFMGLMFIVAAKEIDLKRLPYVTIASQCVIVPLVICLALTGKIENISYMYVRMDQMLVYRQALGFQHPNALGGQIVHFCICWLWLRWKKWQWYDYIVYVISAYFMYTVCNSITSVILIISIAVMQLLYKLLMKRKHTDMVEKLMCICVWGVPVFCILMAYFYSEASTWMTFVDHVISWRFKIARAFLQNYPASLIGCRLPEGAASDNLYIDSIVRYGWIILVIILLGIRQLMKYAVKEKMYPLIISIFIYTVYGVTEQYPYLLMYNFTLLYLVNVIYPNPGMSKES